jgi:5-methylcytosine-specific restriction endonuclease McrA
MKIREEKYHKLIELQNYICGLCGGSLKKEWEDYVKWRSLTRNERHIKRAFANIDIDHKIPKSKLRGIWWKNELINLQLTHKTCNNKKGNSLTPLSTNNK